MIFISYSTSSIKAAEILGCILFLSPLRPAIFCMCKLKENLLFSTLICGSVFSDYVVFYGDALYIELLLL